MIPFALTDPPGVLERMEIHALRDVSRRWSLDHPDAAQDLPGWHEELVLGLFGTAWVQTYAKRWGWRPEVLESMQRTHEERVMAARAAVGTPGADSPRAGMQRVPGDGLARAPQQPELTVR